MDAAQEYEHAGHLAHRRDRPRDWIERIGECPTFGANHLHSVQIVRALVMFEARYAGSHIHQMCVQIHLRFFAQAHADVE